MKFAMAGYGSRGDIEPLAAVGRELLRRGHDVRAAVTANQLGLAESAGLAAVAYGPDPNALRTEVFRDGMIQHPVVGVTEHFTRAYAEWGATLTTLADGADLLLTCANEQVLATGVAEYYGIPLATLHYFPGAPSGLGGLIGCVAKEAQDAQRRAFGLPEVPGPSTSLEIHAYDELCFPGLAAERTEQVGRQHFVGALTLEMPTDADGEVLSWIADGTPPIYFGFGSNAGLPSPPETVAVISAACARLGERALVCSGASDFMNIAHFDNVKIVDSVSHAAVFPACRAVVHHGGAGTTAAGLRAGIPTLVLTLWVDDQPIWASAVEQLKVGTGRAFLASTLDSLIADLSYVLDPQCVARAREVAAQLMTAAESVSRTADLLEETVRQGPRAGG